MPPKLLFHNECIYCSKESDLKINICKSCLDQIHFLCRKVHVKCDKYCDSIWAFAAYEGVWLEIIHSFKYGKSNFANRIISSIIEQKLPNLEHIDAIVPVPMHVIKYIKRGYNQAAIISNMISALTGKKVIKRALVKNKKRKQQARLSMMERKQNVASSFSCPRFFPKKISGLNILLVDDVVTSGATISECSKILKKAGVKRVDVLTLAKPL